MSDKVVFVGKSEPMGPVRGGVYVRAGHPWVGAPYYTTSDIAAYIADDEKGLKYYVSVGDIVDVDEYDAWRVETAEARLVAAVKTIEAEFGVTVRTMGIEVHG